jgi:hypothetical protein
LHFSLENQRIPALLAPGLLAAQASLAQLQGFPASQNAIQRCPTRLQVAVPKLVVDGILEKRLSS